MIKYIGKPLHIRKTDTGFRDTGEAMIVKYENGLCEYLIMKNDLLLFRDSHMTSNQIRKNSKILDDFSNSFKERVIENVFEDPDLNNIEKFVEYYNA